MVGVVQRCKDIVPEVWKAENTKSVEDKQGPGGADEVLSEPMVKTSTAQPPVVKDFEKLSLLG
jgi:hypothetical protein